MHFSINCSVVVCSPTVIHAILREATSETYGPGSLFYYITSLLFTSHLVYYFAIFIFQSIQKIPKIFIWLSLSDLTFARVREGIDNPFIAVVARFLIVCAGTRWLVRRLLLDWYLGSQNWGKYLRYFAASPFPLQGKTNACSRSSKKDFWRRCRGDLRQAKTYQLPIKNSRPSHYIIRHSPLVFLSPTSKMIFEKIRLFFAPPSLFFLVCFLSARVLDCLLCHDGSR